MSENRDIFWQKMLENASVLNNTSFSKQEFLKDICLYFDISNAFIYEINHLGLFEKRESFNYKCVPPSKDIVDLKTDLGPELLSELSSANVLISQTQNSKLISKLNEIFKAETIILIPILNQHYELAGLVGLSDRRHVSRKETVDIKNSCSVLSLLASRVKLELFEKGIASTENVLNNVLDHIGIDIYVNDYYTHDILYINKSMAAPYGTVDELLGKKCHKEILNFNEPCEFCPQPLLLDEYGNLNKTYTWDYERALDGSWFRVLSSSFPWSDGRTAHLVASLDITESKKNQILIEKLAQFDHLTGLPNRRSLQDDIDKLITSDTEFYVLFCDLNGFKQVNDNLGHNIGDALLIAIANNLSSFDEKKAKAYRLGGDEFVIIAKDLYDADEMREGVSKILNIFQNTYILNSHSVKCGSSIGISHYPTTATTQKDLFHAADTAMYEAKKLKKLCTCKNDSIRICLDSSFLTIDEYLKKITVCNHCD